MARACSERWVSFFGDRRSSSFSNANDSALDSNRTGLPAGTSSSCQMRLASGRMACRSRLRTGVASGPSDEQIVQQDDGRGQCLTRLVFRSNVMLADAISRPSTSAANVPIRPVVILTTSRGPDADAVPTTRGERRHRAERRQISRQTQGTRPIDRSWSISLRHVGG